VTAGVAEAGPAPPPRLAWTLGRLDPLLPAAVVLVLCGLFQLRTCAKLVLADYSNLAGEEYNVVYSVERLIGEGVLYTDPARPPFAVVQYGPLYYWAGRGLAGLAGLHAGDALAITRLLRGFSFACLLAQIGVVAVILRRHLGAPWRVVVIAVVALLSFQTPWCLAGRPDSLEVTLMIASTLLGLEAARGVEGGRPAAWLAASLVCGALAILTKQSGFVAGLIVLPPALVALGLRRTVIACAAAAAAAAPIAAGLLLASGPAIRENVIGGVDNGLSLRTAMQVTYTPYLRLMAAPAAGAILAAVAALAARRRGPGGRAASAVGWGTLVALVLATLLGLKYGSFVNYYNLFNAFIVLSIGAFLAASPGPEARGWRGLVALFLVLFLPAKAYGDLNSRPAPTRPYAECAEVAGRLRELLGTGPGGPMFFSQDPRLDCLLPDRAAAPGKLVSAILYRRGVADYSNFARAVRDGAVRYCVTLDDQPANLTESFARFARGETLEVDPDRPTFLGASFDGFRLLFRVGPHAVYESPQNGNRAGSSDMGRRSP
jgi:hypothetical protein